jgi:hypothetical protein
MAASTSGRAHWWLSGWCVLQHDPRGHALALAGRHCGKATPRSPVGIKPLRPFGSVRLSMTHRFGANGARICASLASRPGRETGCRAPTVQQRVSCVTMPTCAAQAVTP